MAITPGVRSELPDSVGRPHAKTAWNEWHLLKLKSPVIASVAWQSPQSYRGSGDCFVPRNDDYLA